MSSGERHFLALDSQENVIHSNLPESCLACHTACSSNEVTNSCGQPGKRRRGRATSPSGTVFICTNEKDFVASTKLFKKELEFFSLSISRIEQMKVDLAKIEVQKSRRLFHNLISLNAHSLQDLYSVISQDQLGDLGGGGGIKRN